jgi:hypothetical protein
VHIWRRCNPGRSSGGTLKASLPVRLECTVVWVGVDFLADALELLREIGDRLGTVADRLVLHLRCGMEPSGELVFVRVKRFGAPLAGGEDGDGAEDRPGAFICGIPAAGYAACTRAFPAVILLAAGRRATGSFRSPHIPSLPPSHPAARRIPL